MERNWYRRMLLSYFPIFLVTITILVFLSFIIVNDISQQETVKADKISTEYVVDTLQLSLKEIEMNVLEEVEQNHSYDEFLHTGYSGSSREAVYAVVNSLRELRSKDMLIDSIYVYRNEGRQTLTSSGVVEWDGFADKAFIEDAQQNPEYQGWSSIRTYHELNTDKERHVVSMYKRAPLPFGTQGFIVVNVDMYALEQMIRSMKTNDLSFIDVRNAEGDMIFTTRQSDKDTGGISQGRILNSIYSPLTGWTYESGIAVGQLFEWVSVVSYIWVVLGITTVVGAIVYILYITKRNYKPIRVMMNRIEAVRNQMDYLQNPKGDELTLIDQALENLIQQTTDYEKQQHENMLIGRRQLFMDLVQGERLGDLKDRWLKLKPLSKYALNGRLAIVLVEIIHYRKFQSGFSKRDQGTLKFAVTNALQEIAREEGIEGWGEWTEANRMGIMLELTAEEVKHQEKIRRLADRGVVWTRENLGVELIMSIGPECTGWEEISGSYRSAAKALDHKLSLGKEAIIMSENLPDGTSRKVLIHLQEISEFVRQFRLSNGEWRFRLESIFDSIEGDSLKDEEIRMLLQTMMDLLGRELGDLSEQMLEFFTGEKAEYWLQSIETTVSLEQLRSLSLELLSEIYRTFIAECETKSHRAMTLEMRTYIEEHFADPDLSLKHLSDRFQISGKYASYLFKEEFNMKFVNFLVHLRLEKAERLLVDTDETIQEIALQVGYANSITFGRTFKREKGVTPSDYRKLKAKTQREISDTDNQPDG